MRRRVREISVERRSALLRVPRRRAAAARRAKTRRPARPFTLSSQLHQRSASAFSRQYVIPLSRYIVVRGSEVLVRFGALSNASVEPGQPDVAMGNERADAEFTRTLGTTGQVASSRRVGRPCQILRRTSHRSRGSRDAPPRVFLAGRVTARCSSPVLGVVPGEEDVTVPAGVLDRAEALRELSPREVAAVPAPPTPGVTFARRGLLPSQRDGDNYRYLPAAGRLVAARSRLAHCADAAPCVGHPRLLGRSCDERLQRSNWSARSREMLTRR